MESNALSARLVFTALWLLLPGCSAKPHEPASNGPSGQPLDSKSATAEVRPAADKSESDTPRTTQQQRERIQALIRALADIEDFQFVGWNSIGEEAFASVPWSGRTHGGIPIGHDIKYSDAFTALVDAGPAALPYLLESLDDKTVTQLTIKHPDDFGGMWYGQRPAIRWVASEAYMIRDLAAEGAEDNEIRQRLDVPAAFIATAKVENLPHFLPLSHAEFNPVRPQERRVIEQARTEFLAMATQQRDIDSFDSAIHQYTVTVGDVCYAIIGHITNRAYVAVQYQPTACWYIHSPTHDEPLAADVRSVWTSDSPAEMLFRSLMADFDAANRRRYRGRKRAIRRLGYYYPQRSEKLLLELFDEINAPLQGDKKTKRNQLYVNSESLEAMGASKSIRVRERLRELLRTTAHVRYFLALERSFGEENEALVLRRAMHFVNTVPESRSYDVCGTALLEMLARRFPAEAKHLRATKRGRSSFLTRGCTAGIAQCTRKELRPLLGSPALCAVLVAQTPVEAELRR